MLKYIIILCSIILSLQAGEYSLRKYPYVTKFYKEITLIAIEVGLQHNIPPAAMLAIAGIESGYGGGYVAQITGNILSLGANKGDTALPPLYLPYSKKEKKILFDPQEIKQHPKEDLSWKLRAKSYKKDYRPAHLAGEKKDFEFLKYNETARMRAYKENFSDFATKFISSTSRYKPFSSTRKWLDELVAKHGKEVLLDPNVNREFIERIGGRTNSFNYRKSWPKKVIYTLKHAGLVELVSEMKNKKSFEEAWKKRS